MLKTILYIKSFRIQKLKNLLGFRTPKPYHVIPKFNQSFQLSKCHNEICNFDEFLKL